jgi:hypothetical protein
MSRDDFFGNLFDEAQPAAEDLKIIRQLAYEERVIKRVFTECSARPNAWGRLVIDCKSKTQLNKLNFGWFNNTYLDFPGKLVGKRIPFMHKVTLVDLFKPANKNRLIKAISKELNINNIDPLTDRYIFVFPVVRTAFCAHSFSNLASSSLDTARPQFVVIPPTAGRLLVVEPLKSFCNALGANWANT